MVLTEIRRYIRRELVRYQILENLKQAKEYLKNGKLSDKELKGLLEIDPTPQKKYVGWMAKKWIESGKDSNGVAQLTSTIPAYDKLVNKNKTDEKDINKFKSIKDLTDTVDVIMSTGDHLSVSDLEKDVDTVLSNKELLIMSPHTHEASRKLGLTQFAHRSCDVLGSDFNTGEKDSAWCTTYKAPNHFNDYYFIKNVTFYYTKIMSKKIISNLKTLFPQTYKELVVIAFAVLPPKNGKITIDAYDGKDRQLQKKDIQSIISLLGIKKLLQPQRVESRGLKQAQQLMSKINKDIRSGGTGNIIISDVSTPFIIPKNLVKVEGNLIINNSNVSELPSNLIYVKGKLSISKTNITEIPQSLKNIGELSIEKDGDEPDIVSLPNDLTTEKINISDHKIKNLPTNLTCPKMGLYGCHELVTIPTINNLKTLHVMDCKKLKNIPAGIDKLVLEFCPNITTIPPGVYKELVLMDTRIRTLPKGVIVKGRRGARISPMD